MTATDDTDVTKNVLGDIPRPCCHTLKVSSCGDDLEDIGSQLVSGYLDHAPGVAGSREVSYKDIGCDGCFD